MSTGKTPGGMLLKSDLINLLLFRYETQRPDDFILESEAHPAYVNVWRCLHYEYGVFGPFFFEIFNGKYFIHDYINTKNYMFMLRNFFLPQVWSKCDKQSEEFKKQYFQQVNIFINYF